MSFTLQEPTRGVYKAIISSSLPSRLLYMNYFGICLFADYDFALFAQPTKYSNKSCLIENSSNHFLLNELDSSRLKLLMPDRTVGSDINLGYILSNCLICFCVSDAPNDS